MRLTPNSEKNDRQYRNEVGHLNQILKMHSHESVLQQDRKMLL